MKLTCLYRKYIAPIFQLFFTCVLEFESCSQQLSDVPQLKLWLVFPLASGFHVWFLMLVQILQNFYCKFHLESGLDAHGAKVTRVKEDYKRGRCRQVVLLVAILYFQSKLVRELVICGPFVKAQAYKQSQKYRRNIILVWRMNIFFCLSCKLFSGF